MSWIARDSIYAFFREMRRGYKAVITQSYTEANVKNGVQFSYSSYIPALPTSGVVEYVLSVGSKPLAMKGRTFQYDGLGVKVEVFEAPDITGGTATGAVRGLNSMNQAVSEVQVLTGMTVNSDGTPFTSERHYLGDSGVGNAIATTVSEEIFGLETIYKPNTNFLVRVTSLDATDTQRLASYVTWYEGDFDLPSD